MLSVRCFSFHDVNAASQSFQTGSYPRRRMRSATSRGERSSAMSNCPVACVARFWWGEAADEPAREDARPTEFGAAHSLAPNSTIRPRSEEHTSELQSRGHLVCRLLLEKK